MGLRTLAGLSRLFGGVCRCFKPRDTLRGLFQAEEAICRTAQLYAVEKEARGSPRDRRIEIRQAKARRIFEDLEDWLGAQLSVISGKSPLAAAIRYALTRMTRLRPYLDHVTLELDNNPAERAMRAIALGREKYLFVGSQTGGKAAERTVDGLWAAIGRLVDTFTPSECVNYCAAAGYDAD